MYGGKLVKGKKEERRKEERGRNLYQLVKKSNE